MDKLEIIAAAQQLGTFEISIEPDADCCTLFVPKHPATRMSSEEVHGAEAKLDISGLVTRGCDEAKVETFDYDPVRPPFPRDPEI
jgi:thiamine biosynthesis protein ThiI